MSEAGLFDMLSPLFALLDGFMARQLGLSALWRIAVFAVIASVLSMFVYRYLSNQSLIAQLKVQIRDVQRTLSQTHLQAGELRTAIKKNLTLTGRQLFLSFWPALLASVPIVFLLVFCSNQFSYSSPAVGDRRYVTPIGLHDSPADYSWQGGNVQWDARKRAWTFYDQGDETLILNYRSEPQLRLPTLVSAGVLHKKRWWNWLIANPAGYLDENARIDQFEFNTPTQRIIDWGPAWMRGWMFAFIVFLLIFSLAIKRVWKIH